MAPPTPGRVRGPRPQVNNNIGEAGRTTNIAAPKGVPRDSAGHERPDAFFNRAGAHSDDEYDDDDGFDDPQPARAKQQSAKKKSAANGARAARGERPDRYMLGEDRGRKTGVVKAVAQRDDEGFESIDGFFQSSPARSVATTAARSTVKKTNQRMFRPASPEYGDEDEAMEQDESDMMVDDDGTSLSPLTYQRQHPASARQPSALRHSTLPSGARSVSCRGLATSSPRANGGSARSPRRRLSSLSGDGEEDDDDTLEYTDHAEEDEREPEHYEQDDEEEEDEDEDEVVEAALTAKKPAASSAAAKGKGKARASTSTLGSPAARRVSGASTPAGSPTGLMKLDKNGRPVEVLDRKGKGKAVERSPTPPEEIFFENDYGGGFDDEDQGEEGVGGFHFDDEAAHDDDEDEEEDEGPHVAGPSSKPMKAKAKAKPQAKGKGKGRVRASNSPPKKASQRGAKKAPASRDQPREVVIDLSKKRGREESVDADVRRSTREKIPRLEYWRNERIVYKRRSSGIGVNAIVRVPKADPEPLSKADRKKAGGRRGTSARAASRAGTVKNEVPEEQGVDDMTDPDGLVWSWEGDAEVSRRIAFTAAMMNPRPTFDGKFSYQKIYQELDYLAGGILTIPPNGEKALKPSKDNSYIFYCIQGSVSVTVHRTVFSIGPGGTFFIPRSNTYRIQATSNREVRLFFAQGRRVLELEDGSTRPDTKEDSLRYLQEQELAALEEEEEEEEEIIAGAINLGTNINRSTGGKGALASPSRASPSLLTLSSQLQYLDLD
ncbi:mitotic fidelity of chromosome transmission-related protein [Rhodotorula kratochvilovae]